MRTGAIPVPDSRVSRLGRVLDADSWRSPRLPLDCLGLVLAVAFTIRWPGDPLPWSDAWPLALGPLLTVGLLAYRGMYRRRLRSSMLERVAPVVGSISVAVMMLVVLQVYVARHPFELGALAHIWALSIVGVGGPRIALAGAHRMARNRGLIQRPALIIGAGEVGLRVARRLQQDCSYGLSPIGFLDANPMPHVTASPGDVPWLGTLEQLEPITRVGGVRHVILAFSATPDAQLVELVQRCEALGLHVTVVPRLYESVNGRFQYESMGGLPVFVLRQTRPRGVGFAVKHMLDRVVAATALVLMSPLLLVLAAGIRCSSAGPTLFRQRRIGRDGKTFDLLKFRSMAIPKASPGVKFAPVVGQAPGGVEGVDRRTRIGRLMRRTSLDELPQLINVLRGHMSLVGPRPERPEFAELFGKTISRYDDRHRVKSGITGWAQVHGLRGQTSLDNRIEWDNFYIAHWSPGLDFRILLLTLVAVFRTAE